MGFFADLTTGIIEGARANGSGYQERGRIERLCRELGWSIDERNGDRISLHFKDAIAGIRKVHISSGDDSLVLLAVYSYLILPASDVPPEIFGHLLLRNSETALGAWQASRDSDGDALFNLRYVASGRGLTAALLKYICDGLIQEAAGFDARMSQAGLLRV